MSSTKSRTANHLSSSYESQQESTFCGRVLALELFPNPYTHCKTKTQQMTVYRSPLTTNLWDSINYRILCPDSESLLLQAIGSLVSDAESNRPLTTLQFCHLWASQAACPQGVSVTGCSPDPTDPHQVTPGICHTARLLPVWHVTKARDVACSERNGKRSECINFLGYLEEKQPVFICKSLTNYSIQNIIFAFHACSASCRVYTHIILYSTG